jgi:hypothetical protein
MRPDSYQNLKNRTVLGAGDVPSHGIRREGQSCSRNQKTKLATKGPTGSLSHDGPGCCGYWIATKSNDLWLVDFDRVRKTGKVDRPS